MEEDRGLSEDDQADHALGVSNFTDPVGWEPRELGEEGRLSTAEALAASLYIVGLKEEASEILKPFSFSDSFMSLNKEPLEAYASCSSGDEVIEVQWEFFD